MAKRSAAQQHEKLAKEKGKSGETVGKDAHVKQDGVVDGENIVSVFLA